MDNLILSDKDLYIDELASKIHQGNVEKEFWPENKEERNKSEVLMLVVSEVAEAQEALRDSHYCELTTDEKAKMFDLFEKDPELYKEVFKVKVKNSFEDEMLDVLIRQLDAIKGFNIDLLFHLRAKLLYNSLRPKKHGKNF